MKESTKTIAIDFDGTLCKKQSYGDGEIYELPNPGALEVLERLHEDYRIVIYTCRLDPEQHGGEQELQNNNMRIKNWLRTHELMMYVDHLTGTKPQAVAYIDDRAIRFTNWRDMGNYFLD